MTLPDLPAWLTREHVSIAFLGICAFGFAIFMVFESARNERIRCTDLLTGDNGRLASNKTFQTLAFLLSAWAMVFMTITARVDAVAWGAWVAVWAGAALTNKVVIGREAKAHEDTQEMKK